MGGCADFPNPLLRSRRISAETSGDLYKYHISARGARTHVRIFRFRAFPTTVDRSRERLPTGFYRS